MTALIRAAPRGVLEHFAADTIAQAISNHPHGEGPIILGLCGGRSVEGIYRLLAERADLPWQRVHIFLVDERRVPINHPDSNFRLVNETFTAPLVDTGALPAENLHPFISDESAPGRGTGAYARELDHLGGRFHIAILSAGEDGHVAALYPSHSALEQSAPTFLALNDSPKPPPRRITCSLPLLARSAMGLLLLFGEGKREALRRLMDPGVSVAECPAKVIESLPVAHILTDQELT